MNWETVIGLEVHAQLSTQSKLFSSSATSFGAEPNQHASIIDLGLPGTLPVVNQKAVELAVRFGLSIDANITRQSVFERKNYFYPDLPKGYQISQFEKPIVGPGRVLIRLEDGTKKTINVTRAHLEEDAGKSIHDAFDGMTGVDLNRAGTPLLEIVSEPEIRSSEEAYQYLHEIRKLVRYLEISNGNMEEGSLRCDANISVRPLGEVELRNRVEVKNINSLKNVMKAIDLEAARQIQCYENNQIVDQETRNYNAANNTTTILRSKEDAHDYRYFPEPDIPPLIISESFISDIKTLNWAVSP